MLDTKSMQALFDRLFAEGKQETTSEADRELEGSYVNGYKNFITTSTLEHGGFTIVATTTKWMTMSPAADQDGTRYSFEVKRGDEVIFKASREGASTSKNFGAEERYIGDENFEAKDWLVGEGELPAELESIAA